METGPLIFWLKEKKKVTACSEVIVERDSLSTKVKAGVEEGLTAAVGVKVGVEVPWLGVTGPIG